MSLLPKAVSGTPATVRKFKDDGFQFSVARLKRVKLQGIDRIDVIEWLVKRQFKSVFVSSMPQAPFESPVTDVCITVPQLDAVRPTAAAIEIQEPLVSRNYLLDVTRSKPYLADVSPPPSDVTRNILQVGGVPCVPSRSTSVLETLVAQCQLKPCNISKNLVERARISENLVASIQIPATISETIQPADPRTQLVELRAFDCVRCERQDVATLEIRQQCNVRLVSLESIEPIDQLQIDICVPATHVSLATVPEHTVSVWEEEVRFEAVNVIGTVLNGLPQSSVDQTGVPDSFRVKTPRTKTSTRSLFTVTKRRPRSAAASMLKLLLPVLRPNIEKGLGGHLDLPGQLRHYQVDGIYRLVSNSAFLLADEMGTGKTVMSIIAIRILIQRGSIFSVIVVCPKSILNVWENHLAKWAPDLTVSVAYGDPALRDALWSRPAHVYITTYDVLVKDVGQGVQAHHSNRFDLIIADEAHTLKNLTTRRSQAARKIAAEYRWGLTGTPIQNSVDELLSLFRFIKPDLFETWLTGRNATPAYIRAKIEPHFLRRRKIDVMPELPPKIYSDEWFELDGHQRAEYSRLLTQFQRGSSPVNRIAIFSLIQKLKQICNFATGQHSSPKSEALVEQISEIVASGQKVLVFTQYVEAGVLKLIPLLKKFGLSVITGEVSLPERQRLVKRFQEEPHQQVFLATTKTAGEGLTLTAASYIVHFDHWWNPAVEWQAEDRAHRMGQTQSVNIYNYWVADTIEQKIRALLEKKGLLHQQYVEALANVDFGDVISTEELCGMLGIDIRRLTR